MSVRPPSNWTPQRRTLDVPGNRGAPPVGPPGYLNTGIIQPMPEKFINTTTPRGTVWATLQTPTHPDYTPYQTVTKIGSDGRRYKVYPKSLTTVSGGNWPVDGVLSQGFDPSLLRREEGQRFQKEHSDDPCPEGWLQSKDRGYCERFGNPKMATRTIYDGPPKGKNAGLYSNKAYIPLDQPFPNAEPPEWGHAPGVAPRIESGWSDSSMFRSHDFETGGWSVFYPPHPDSKVTTYLPLRELKPNIRYDPSWGMPPMTTQQKFARLPVGDSYL